MANSFLPTTQNDNVLVKDCTLSQFTEALIRGNGFGHDIFWIKSHFGGTKFCIVEDVLHQYEHNIAQFVMTDFFKSLGFEKIGETYYDDAGEIAVTYENIYTDLDKTIRVYKNAFVLYERKDAYDASQTERLCVSINNYGPKEITYRIYAIPTRDSVLVDWMNYARKHNFYKNKKIDADCNFLQLAAITWDDIILEDKTVQVIKTHVKEQFTYSEYLKANGMSLKRGVILSGPPGTGKTMIAKVFAKETECTVIYALPSHLEIAASIGRVCDMAKDLAPCMLIIEDIDWLAENRDESSNAGAVIQLMNYLEGVQEFNDIVTLATTNNADRIEEAVKNRPGRFDRVISIPKPGKGCRRKMINSFTKNYIMQNVDIEKIVEFTKDLSGAHVKDLCRTAALFAIREMSVDENKKAIVKQSHFDGAIAEVSNIDYSSYQKSQSNVRKNMGFSNLDVD